MRIVFHPRAVEDATRIDSWWTANRPAAPGLVHRELEAAVAAVADLPTLGASSTAESELPGVRRVLMTRTRYHVYYRVTADVLEVLAIWHAVRGEGPTLG